MNHDLLFLHSELDLFQQSHRIHVAEVVRILYLEVASGKRSIVCVYIDIIVSILSYLNHIFNFPPSFWVQQSISIDQVLFLLKRVESVIEIHVHFDHTFIWQHILLQSSLFVHLWDQWIEFEVHQVPLWEHLVLLIQYSLDILITHSILYHLQSLFPFHPNNTDSLNHSQSIIFIVIDLIVCIYLSVQYWLLLLLMMISMVCYFFYI